MDERGTGGRVGGTQFDDKVIIGRRSEDVIPKLASTTECPVCNRRYLSWRFTEHKAEHDD